MDKQILIFLIQIIITLAAYLIGRYLIPNMPKETIQDVTAKVDLIINYADKFVAWAKWFKKDSTGTEKMAAVIEQLINIANKYNLDISEEEIEAIAQKAYDQMKAGLEEAENQKIIAEATKENAANNIIVPQVQYNAGQVIPASAEKTDL